MGVAWNGSSTIYGLVLQTLGTVVLARVIGPSSFGIFAIVSVFYAYGAIVSNLGLGTALIQRPRLTEHHLATAFWLNAALGVVLTVALTALAPLIAEWVGQPVLSPLLRLVSLSYTINMAVVPLAILERGLRFRAVAIIESVSATLGLATALVAGVAGLGATALAMQLLVQTVTTSILAFVAARWVPNKFPSMVAFRELWSVSFRLTGGNLIGYWSMNADTLALGATQTAADLGYYNRAFNLLMLPLRTLAGTITRVIVPALASLQYDVTRSRDAWLSTVRILALVSFPVSVGMAACADGLVETLWGPTWAPVVPLLRIMSLAGIPWSIAVAAEWLLFARGRARAYFWLAVANTLLTVIAVLVGLPWGTTGVAIAMLARSFLILPMYIRWCLAEIGINYRLVFQAVGPTLSYSVAMGLIVAAVGTIGSVPSPLLLAMQTLVGVAVMYIFLRVLSPGLLTEMRGLARRAPLTAP